MEATTQAAFQWLSLAMIVEESDSVTRVLEFKVEKQTVGECVFD